MPINFFSVPCNNQVGNCQTESIQCNLTFSDNRFGISDANANSRIPAIVLLENEDQWDFTIENPKSIEVKYKAIDYCVDIFRTGTYDVNDDNSNIIEFSSDNVNTIDREIIKRCEGFLYKYGEWVLFFEIKNRPRRDWLIDARRKFEETILSFKEHHPDLSNIIIEPIVSNKSFFRTHQSEMIQKKILKDKIGVELKIQTSFTID